MVFKNTVAIIGAATLTGALIAKQILHKYRLLLMDVAQPKLVALQNELHELVNNADVDIINCSKNATWEADIIIIAVEGKDLNDVAANMKDVSNCKTVVHFTTADNMLDRLQLLLPHAKVVTVLLNRPATDLNAMDAFIHGKDDEAVEVAKSIVTSVGCSPGNV